MRREPRITGRRQRFKLCARCLRQIEVIDKGLQSRLIDALTAGQRFELFIGLGNTVAAHHRLNRLSEDFPVGIEIFGNARLIDRQFAQAPAGCFIANQAMR